MKKKIAISLKKITKTYGLQRGKSFGRDPNKDVFKALDNVSLDVYQGERIGIVGPNGAGKTTLLKIISGITVPDGGDLVVNGKAVSLIDLSAGFHADLTGMENINLNGLLVGMSRKEVKRRLDEIVEFADIGSFIDEPFYTYSSGMKFRLAFAVAVFSSCDILLMDEVFVSGDIQFQQKAFSMIKEIQKRTNVTTIICSHVPFYVWGLSGTFFELKNGCLSVKKEIDIINEIEFQRKEWRKLKSLNNKTW